MSQDRRKFLTVVQVAELYAVSPDKVYRDIKRGFLPAYSIGESIRIRDNDAEGYAQELNPSSQASQRRRA
jgi:excisionase family DNA binding protein